jgi:hypothetical protein
MATARGTMLLHSEAFVTARYGADAHRKVLEAIPPESAARFAGSLPEGSRVPLVHLVAYMKAAKELLAPGDAQFFHELGRFAGARDREASGFSHMVADRATALKMMKVLWNAYLAEGSFEIVSSDGASATGRVVGFRGDPVLCERITGVVETQLSAARAAHVACVFRGDPACTWTVWW